MCFWGIGFEVCLLLVGNNFAGILVDIRNRLSSVKTLHISNTLRSNTLSSKDVRLGSLAVHDQS